MVSKIIGWGFKSLLSCDMDMHIFMKNTYYISFGFPYVLSKVCHNLTSKLKFMMYKDVNKPDLVITMFICLKSLFLMKFKAQE